MALWVVTATRIPIFPNRNGRIAPDGSVVSSIDGGYGVALADIDLAAARSRRHGGEPVFAQRRPGLYAELLTYTFSWNPQDFFGLYGHQSWPRGESPALPSRSSHRWRRLRQI